MVCASGEGECFVLGVVAGPLILSVYSFIFVRTTPCLCQNKIMRVLQLWQKNSVFPDDTILQLLEMTNGELDPDGLTAGGI